MVQQYDRLQPEQRPPPQRRWSVSYWWWELLSITASIGCVVAVIVILSIMQDKPTDHWNFFITLNATIAIFMTAAKSTAMLAVAKCISQCKWAFFHSKTRKLVHFDIIEDAARGPLGSVVMLARIPWGVATLGVVVTILALGIDTFAQQVLSTDTVTTWVGDGSASFGLTHNYYGGAKLTASGQRWVPDPFTVDTSMQGAVFRAFYDLDTPALFNCTSNCTWDQPHISLGLTSTCVNVTEATYATKSCVISNSTGGQNCTMTTPGNVTFSTATVPTFWSTVLVIKAQTPYSFDAQGTLLTELAPANFMRLAVFQQPSEYRDNIDGAANQTLECDIGFAAYTYSNASSVSNDFTFGPIEKIALDPGYPVPSRRESQGTQDSHILFNTSGLPSFQVSTYDLGALIDFFPSTSFSGSLTDGEEMPVYDEGITAALRNPKRNISQALESMATSMTDQLRSSYNATAQGLTAKTLVLVRVQWGWLALPFLVVLASAVFLIAVMIQSRRSQGVGIWKDSSTAILFHSVSRRTGTLSTTVQGPEQLEQLVKNTRVKLD